MDATFRLAVPADLEILLPMVREFWLIERLHFVEPEVRRALADLLASPQYGLVILAERAGAPIGYLALTLGYSLEFLGRDAFVDELYLREAHRGMGVRNQDFDALVEDLIKSLDKFNVPPREQKELLGLLGPMRKDVVQPRTVSSN